MRELVDPITKTSNKVIHNSSRTGFIWVKMVISIVQMIHNFIASFKYYYDLKYRGIEDRSM
jgi:hypothetical protein